MKLHPFCKILFEYRKTQNAETSLLNKILQKTVLFSRKYSCFLNLMIYVLVLILMRTNNSILYNNNNNI